LRPKAEIRKLEARRAESRVEFWGGDSEPGDLRSAVSSRCGVWAKAPAANAFLCILSSEIASGSNFFDHLFKLKKLK